MTSTKSFAISKRMVFEAWKRVKANRGAAGIDGESIAGRRAARVAAGRGLSRVRADPRDAGVSAHRCDGSSTVVRGLERLGGQRHSAAADVRPRVLLLQSSTQPVLDRKSVV